MSLRHWKGSFGWLIEQNDCEQHHFVEWLCRNQRVSNGMRSVAINKWLLPVRQALWQAWRLSTNSLTPLLQFCRGSPWPAGAAESKTKRMRRYDPRCQASRRGEQRHECFLLGRLSSREIGLSACTACDPVCHHRSQPSPVLWEKCHCLCIAFFPHPYFSPLVKEIYVCLAKLQCIKTSENVTQTIMLSPLTHGCLQNIMFFPLGVQWIALGCFSPQSPWRSAREKRLRLDCGGGKGKLASHPKSMARTLKAEELFSQSKYGIVLKECSFQYGCKKTLLLLSRWPPCH